MPSRVLTKLLPILTPWRGHMYEENIVLHDYATLYLPVQKVACTSIKRMVCEVLDFQIDDPHHRSKGIHTQPYPFVKKKVIASQYADYFVFGFVRNPFDRLVSCYRNKISQDPHLTNDWFVNGVAKIFLKYGDRMWGGMSFAEFAHAVSRIPDEKADGHFRSQWTTFYDQQGTYLPDFVGRFETLTHDMEHVISQTKLPITKLPHLMQSTHAPYQEVYTTEILNVVRRRYEKDLDLFEYTF